MSTSVKVNKLPDCVLCLSLEHKHEPALYDAKTYLGPWAYLCEKHYNRLGIGLGTGLGQKLEVENK